MIFKGLHSGDVFRFVSDSTHFYLRLDVEGDKGNVVRLTDGKIFSISLSSKYQFDLERILNARDHTLALHETQDAETSIEVKNAVDDLVAHQDDGACPDDGCSGGITEGICSHCDDEWAYKRLDQRGS